MKRDKIIAEIGNCLTDEIYDMGRGFEFYFDSKYGFKTVVLKATIDLDFGFTNYLIYAIVRIVPAGKTLITVRIMGDKSIRRGEWKRYDSIEHAVEKYLEKEISGKDLRNTLCWKMMDHDYFVELMRDCYDIEIKT